MYIYCVLLWNGMQQTPCRVTWHHNQTRYTDTGQTRHFFLLCLSVQSAKRHKGTLPPTQVWFRIFRIPGERPQLKRTLHASNWRRNRTEVILVLQRKCLQGSIWYTTIHQWCNRQMVLNPAFSDCCWFVSATGDNADWDRTSQYFGVKRQIFFRHWLHISNSTHKLHKYAW